MKRLALLAVSSLLAGCSDGGGSEEPSRIGLAASLASLAPLAPLDWCAHVAAGPGGAGELPIELSSAHAEVRFFGVHATYTEVDQALAASVGGAGPITEAVLPAYAARLGGAACARPSDATPLRPARVRSMGPVAIVRPGTGEVTLPAGTKAVVVDLRHLPAVQGLREALEAAVAPALASAVPRATSHVRKHYGLAPRDGSVYENSVAALTQPALAPKGTSELPLVLVTGAELAPEAAELAMTLRLANRAWLAGSNVRAEVAEARWVGVGKSGLAYRAQELFSGNARWPDEVPADLQAKDPTEAEAMAAIGTATPPPIPWGPANRPPLLPITKLDEVQPASLGLGEARAALLTVHGTLRRFFPYFHTVGDRIDERLAETLATVDGMPRLERSAFRDVLRRFAESIHDGHNAILDFGSPPLPNWLGVVSENIDGEDVVRRSLDPAIHPGDTIVRIGGEDAKTWYARELWRTSAATEGDRFIGASFFYRKMSGPTEFGLRAPDGTVRTVTATAFSKKDYLEKLGTGPTRRPAGRLGDVGAPDVHYINLAGDVLTSMDDFRAAIVESQSAKGLVVDMRNYPLVDHYDVAQHLIQRDFFSPLFHIPVLTGPARRELDAVRYDIPPAEPSYRGPLVLLVGTGTISAAENFSTMLVDARRLKAVVGRRSAGTNGNVTTVQLPGGYACAFTGLEVLHADGSTFHGIGIVPDYEVAMTTADFRDGRDPELMRAIEVLAAP
ncbi:S41 family peptidase [Pendulispora brunnea]|uniref:S41 family peptidase n=1 Tax=Pendulispora brunnea TaxID=2905690 RepID=A0ABZ2K5R3_9BACT